MWLRPSSAIIRSKNAWLHWKKNLQISRTNTVDLRMTPELRYLFSVQNSGFQKTPEFRWYICTWRINLEHISPNPHKSAPWPISGTKDICSCDFDPRTTITATLAENVDTMAIKICFQNILGCRWKTQKKRVDNRKLTVRLAQPIATSVTEKTAIHKNIFFQPPPEKHKNDTHEHFFCCCCWKELNCWRLAQ